VKPLAIRHTPDSEACQIIFFDFRILRQQIDHRRDKGCVGDVFLLDCGAEILDAEFWNRDLAGAHRGAGENERKINDVEQRRRVEMDVALPIRQAGSQVQNIRKNILMITNGALGAARCTAGVDQRKGCPWIIDWLRWRLARQVHRFKIENSLPGNPHGRRRQR